MVMFCGGGFYISIWLGLVVANYWPGITGVCCMCGFGYESLTLIKQKSMSSIDGSYPISWTPEKNKKVTLPWVEGYTTCPTDWNRVLAFYAFKLELKIGVSWISSLPV